MPFQTFLGSCDLVLDSFEASLVDVFLCVLFSLFWRNWGANWPPRWETPGDTVLRPQEHEETDTEKVCLAVQNHMPETDRNIQYTNPHHTWVITGFTATVYCTT